jgi:alpha/beta superfamily hydrolase
MKASSAAVAAGFGFGAFVAAFALKYLLMPLLIFSCFSLSSSRFLFAGTC